MEANKNKKIKLTPIIKGSKLQSRNIKNADLVVPGTDDSRGDHAGEMSITSGVKLDELIQGEGTPGFDYQEDIKDVGLKTAEK